MDIGEYYTSAMDEVFERNPAAYLETLLNKNTKVSATDIIKLSVSLGKGWEEYKDSNIQVGIIIDDNRCGDINNKIYCFDFSYDLKDILHKGSCRSIVYIIDIEGAIIDKILYKSLLTIKSLTRISSSTNKIAFFLGVKGIDVLIYGRLFDSENHMNNYLDVMSPKLLSISEYNKLLNMFFYECVQFDPNKHYFAREGRVHKNFHQLLKENPKLLYSKPEEIFQHDLLNFLKNNCLDPVILEAKNRFGERYDVWILSSDNNIYVIEIKWLGKSITPEGNIFKEYDKSSRAIEGAYQLREYIDNSIKYTKILGLPKETRIHCGVLVVYDARIEMNDIKFPEEFDKYLQIDLSQHYKIDKNKTPASNIYKVENKKNSGRTQKKKVMS